MKTTIIEVEDSADMRTQFPSRTKTPRLVFIAVPTLTIMLAHVLWFFLRNSKPLFVLSAIEPVMVAIEIMILESALIVLIAGPLHSALRERWCDCKDDYRCSMDKYRQKDETRVEAASRRLKHFKNSNWNLIIWIIREEIHRDMNKYLKNQFQKVNANAIQNWSCRGNDNVDACHDFNVGKKCSKNFSSCRLKTTVHLHICRICKEYIGACLPHPAVDCELLKMLDQYYS